MLARLSIMKSMSDKIRSAAKTLSKLGAKKGGYARAAKLSPERRKEISRKALEARWGKKI